MTSILCLTLLQAAALAVSADPAPLAATTYAEAHRATMETGKPMLVMVSTDWCAPCQMMKKSVLPHVLTRGLLRKLAFAVVNPDRDGELASRLTGGGPIPQLLLFRKTANGWSRKELIGGQSEETVKEFITEGIAQKNSDKTKESSDKSDDKNVPPAGQKTVNHDDTDETRHG
jgi:thioredoxin-like negative regulator of GroEL